MFPDFGDSYRIFRACELVSFATYTMHIHGALLQKVQSLLDIEDLWEEYAICYMQFVICNMHCILWILCNVQFTICKMRNAGLLEFCNTPLSRVGWEQICRKRGPPSYPLLPAAQKSTKRWPKVQKVTNSTKKYQKVPKSNQKYKK